MRVYVWGLLGSLLALAMESLFARHPYGALIPWIWVPAIALNYVVYRLVTGADSLIGAFIVFSVCNVAGRVAITLSMGQPVSRGTWIAVVLLVLANVARKAL